MSEMALVEAVQSLIRRFPLKHIHPEDREGAKLFLRDYIADLSDLPAPLVVDAITKLRRSSTFMPSVAEIRDMVVNAAVPELSSGEAWSVVQKQIGKHGFKGYERCDFGDQAIADAVRSVGWRRICLDDNEKGFVRRDFDTAYETAVKRQRRGVQDGTVALPAIVGGNVRQLDRGAA